MTRLTSMQEPYPAVRHDACVAQRENLLFYYGGRPPECVSACTGVTEFGDLWSLDLDTCKWTLLCEETPAPQLCQETPPAGPEARHSACMWCWGDSLFLFGGAARRTGSECTFGDFWRYSLTRKCWTLTPLRGAHQTHHQFWWLSPVPAASQEMLRSCAHLGDSSVCISTAMQNWLHALLILKHSSYVQVTPHRPAQRRCWLSVQQVVRSSAGATPQLLFVLHLRPRMGPRLWTMCRHTGD